MMRILCGLVLLTLMSCNSDMIFHDFEETNLGWSEQDTIAFELDITKTGPYDVSITLRNTIDYPFYNLYYRYELVSSLGHVVKSDLKEVILFDPKSGKPFGSGLGDVYDHEFDMLNNYKWEDVGNYEIRILQYMRVDTLRNIDRVGLKIVTAIP